MKLNRSVNHYWQSFLHPRVIIFILTGVIIIFLTFFTTNNALEISISGIASVFIGIGVNNFSSFETHLKDQKNNKAKMAQALKLMRISQSRISQLNHENKYDTEPAISKELTELEQLIIISIQLIKETTSPE